ncbi:MAG: LeuD/DmdB family oxidoreductase small subunit [Candidatus Thorarchaeota archaeon]
MAWRFGDNVNTDQIIQGKYLTLLDYTEMSKHAFEISRPDFANGVKKNDIIVAGCNFGGGSSREEAPRILAELGIGCIVAESFARIFYRNSFNIGLPLLVLPEVSKFIKEGDLLQINLTDGSLQIEGNDETLTGRSLPEMMLDLLRAGGAVAWYKKRAAKN